MKHLLTKPMLYLLWIIFLILFASHSYGETVNYSYDDDEYGQLQEVQYEEQASIAYQYDTISNRLTRTVKPTRGSTAMETDFATPLPALKEYAYNNPAPAVINNKIIKNHLFAIQILGGSHV